MYTSEWHCYSTRWKGHVPQAKEARCETDNLTTEYNSNGLPHHREGTAEISSANPPKKIYIVKLTRVKNDIHYTLLYVKRQATSYLPYYLPRALVPSSSLLLSITQMLAAIALPAAHSSLSESLHKRQLAISIPVTPHKIAFTGRPSPAHSTLSFQSSSRQTSQLARDLLERESEITK